MVGLVFDCNQFGSCHLGDHQSIDYYDFDPICFGGAASGTKVQGSARLSGIRGSDTDLFSLVSEKGIEAPARSLSLCYNDG